MEERDREKKGKRQRKILEQKKKKASVKLVQKGKILTAWYCGVHVQKRQYWMERLN